MNSLKGHEKILKSLLEATTSYYYKNATALHVAAAGGYLDVVQWLVEHGQANVEATDYDGKTVLHYAAQRRGRDQYPRIRIISVIFVRISIRGYYPGLYEYGYR